MAYELPNARLAWLAFALSVVVPSHIVSGLQVATDDARPYVLRVEHKTRKPVGLLYTPETLMRLLSNQPDKTVSQRIIEAVRRQTPIVVMWSLPSSFTDQYPDPDRPGSYPRPYKIAIVNPSDDPASVNRIDPIWIQQDASELRRLDNRTEYEDVGAMAAFPREAFVPGRQVFIYSDYWNKSKQLVGHRIGASIEWNGAEK